MSDEPKRAYRGGSWHGDLLFAWVVAPGYRDGRLGLRLVEVTDDPTPDPTPDPAPSGSDRVFRGGGWSDSPQLARVAYRISSTPGRRSSALGVRLVEEVD